MSNTPNERTITIEHEFDTVSRNLQLETISAGLSNSEKLSHYTSVEGLLGILQSRALRFTEFAYLNDNSEGEYIFQVLRNILKTNTTYDTEFKETVIKELDARIPNDLYNFTGDLYDYNYSRYFICCFSCDDDSLSMWNYYTKNPTMKGYCIEFDVKGICEGLSNYYRLHEDTIDYACYRILYKTDEQENFLNKLLSHVFQVWREEKDNYIIRLLISYLNSIRFAFKHHAFENEKEIRFVAKMTEVLFQKELQSREKNSEFIKLRPIGDYIVPYIEVPFQQESIKSIRVSPLIKELKARESIKFMLKKYGYNEEMEILPSDIPLRY